MSFRSLLRSTMVLGSSSAATTVVGILRVKALALMVGPAGVGLLGALAAISSVGTSLAAIGADTSGTRSLAMESGDPAAVARLRRTLRLMALLHGAAAALVVWLAREPLADLILGGPRYADEVGLLGGAIALSLLAGLQIAQLQGLGRVRDIARVNIASSILGTIVGLVAVWQLGIAGLIVLVLAQPTLAAILAAIATGRIAPPDAPEATIRDVLATWRGLVVQGAPYMVSFIVLAAAPLVVRALVIGDLGMEAAGHFHAAWTMSVIYIGFLLNAMSADYFPRLTALVADRPAASSLINDQIELALSIGGVVLIAMLAWAPILVPLLFSDAFRPAVRIVEWQALGNMMKIAGWPIAFLSMARGRSLQFSLIEMAWSILFVALVWLGLPHLGLEATGIAYAASCGAFLVLQLVVASATYGFRLRRNAVLLMIGIATAGAITFAAARASLSVQLVTGGLLVLLLGIHSLAYILDRIGTQGLIGTLATRLCRLRRPSGPTLSSPQQG